MKKKKRNEKICTDLGQDKVTFLPCSLHVAMFWVCAVDGIEGFFKLLQGRAVLVQCQGLF